MLFILSFAPPWIVCGASAITAVVDDFANDPSSGRASIYADKGVGMSVKDERKQVLFIIIDAAERSFIENNLSQLANFRRFFDGKTVNPLSTDPFAGSLYNTFQAGATPGHHGVYFQLQWDPAEMRLRSLSESWVGEAPVFWRDLANDEHNIIALDLPFVFKNKSTKAREIYAWSQHEPIEPFSSNVPGEFERIKRDYGVNPIGADLKYDKTAEVLESERDMLIRSAKTRSRLARDLMERYPWDLFLLSFAETHRGGHFLWENPHHPAPVPKGAFLDVVKAVDQAFGEVVDAAPATCEIIVAALHGMSHQPSQSHLIHAMLDAALADLYPNENHQAVRTGPMAWLRDNLPASLQWEMVQRLPHAVKDFVVAREYTGGLVPGKTRAFPLRSDNNGYWRLLVQGREAQGTLTESEADSFRSNFASILSEFTTRDGVPLARRVSFPTQDYDGPRAHLLPDILAEWNPALHPVTEAFHPKLGRITGTPFNDGRPGNHLFHGFFLHSGTPPVDYPTPQHVADLAGYVSALVNQRVSTSQ